MTDDLAPPTEPTHADDFDLRDPPSWPKVVGIISIVWGGLGLVCGLGGIVMMPVGTKMMEPMLAGDPPPPTNQFGAMDYGIAALGLGLAVLLLVAGIMTVGRKRAGWTAHLIYAAISIPLVLFSAYNNLQKQAGVEQWAKDFPSNDYAQMINNSPGGVQQASAIGGLVVLLIFGLGYPLFCIIWFGLIKTKHEQMTGGAEDVY